MVFGRRKGRRRLVCSEKWAWALERQRDEALEFGETAKDLRGSRLLGHSCKSLPAPDLRHANRNLAVVQKLARVNARANPSKYHVLPTESDSLEVGEA